MARGKKQKFRRLLNRLIKLLNVVANRRAKGGEAD